MHKYEVFIILKPGLSETEVETTRKDFEQNLASDGVSMDSHEIKLSQQLSYPIKKNAKGHFVRWVLSTPKSFDITKKVNEALLSNENVLRKLVFTRSEQKESTRKPITVIDQLRHQERPVSPSSQTRVSPSQERPAKEPVVSQEEKKTDLEEIDKKIEELLI